MAQIKGLIKKYGGWLSIVIIIAWIILPTATPEDLITTLPIISIFGLKIYSYFAIASIIVVILTAWASGFNPLKVLK